MINNLRDFRKRLRKVSQSDLADAVGVTRAAINKLENGKEPTLQTALKLAAFFECDVDKIFPAVDLPSKTAKDFGFSAQSRL